MTFGDCSGDFYANLTQMRVILEGGNLNWENALWCIFLIGERCGKGQLTEGT